VWFTVLWVDSRWDNTITLSFPIWHFTIVINDDVAGFTSSLSTDNSLDTDDLTNKRLLSLEGL
jgi:hypothetical protein